MEQDDSQQDGDFSKVIALHEAQIQVTEGKLKQATTGLSHADLTIASLQEQRSTLARQMEQLEEQLRQTDDAISARTTAALSAKTAMAKLEEELRTLKQEQEDLKLQHARRRAMLSTDLPTAIVAFESLSFNI
jgi:chromosome segregation ATPase